MNTAQAGFFYRCPVHTEPSQPYENFECLAVQKVERYSKIEVKFLPV